jgi:xylulokinase
MYTDKYVISDAFRTLASPTAQGYMCETVLKSGMQLVDWVVRISGQPLDKLASDAAVVAPGGDGLLVLPYFAGVMNPWWDEAARGAMVGLTLTHTPAHIMRACLEGIALEQALATKGLETAMGRAAKCFITCGGGARSALLVNIMAAALKRPLAISPVSEAVALGASVLAARAVGFHPSLTDALQAMVAKPSRVVGPDPELERFYSARLDVYRDLFPDIRPILHRIHRSETPASPLNRTRTTNLASDPLTSVGFRHYLDEHL